MKKISFYLPRHQKSILKNLPAVAEASNALLVRGDSSTH